MAGVLELFARRAARGRPDISGVASSVLHDTNLLELILSCMPEIAIRSMHHHCLENRNRGLMEHLISKIHPDQIVMPWHTAQTSLADATLMLETNGACGLVITHARRVYEHYAIPGTQVGIHHDHVIRGRLSSPSSSSANNFYSSRSRSPATCGDSTVSSIGRSKGGSPARCWLRTPTRP